jgi:UDP-N-acetylmuramyl pentapeptide phosphotransferase/UDP-N-acetylglucosamine-1-phosphate transferase
VIGSWTDAASPLRAVLAIGASFVVALVVVERFRDWALRRRIVDVANHRSLHSGAVPRGAGVAIVILTIASVSLTAATAPGEPLAAWWSYLAGAAIVAIVSWADDVRGMPVATRLGVHVLAAGLVVWASASFRVVALPGMGTIDAGLVGAILAIAWIVGLTNAFNFMDGSDGIAALQAIVAGLGWAIVGVSMRDPIAIAAASAITGSSAGFLHANWAPASIFMGDVGSAFLGYSFAAIPVIAATSDPRLALAGLLMVWPFVFDTAFTMIQRLRRRERVWEAHRTHLYQRSIACGAGHAEIALEYGAAAVIDTVAAIAWVLRIDDHGVLALAAIAGTPLWLWTRTTMRERRRIPVTPNA